MQLGLHIALLFNLAVAQPVYSILSQNAEFFLAHSSSAKTILTLVTALSLCLPLIIILSVILTRAYYWALLPILLLSATAAMPLIKNIPDLAWQFNFAFALVIGTVCTAFYVRSAGFRMWLTFFSPAIILFPLLFIFTSPVVKIIFDADIYESKALRAKSLPPIILIIFDELTTTALMNEQQQIDRSRYPNIGALANHATWYKNATTVQLATTQVVPAILSGRLPYRGGVKRLPNDQDYPQNIFNWLGGSYEMNVSEKVTSLCPKYLCRGGSSREPSTISMVARDITYLFLHIVTPNELTSNLPDISSNWAGFGDRPSPDKSKTIPTRHSTNGEGSRFEQFIANMNNKNSNTLHVIHAILPHVPYKYLPDGLVYSHENGVPEGVQNERWTTNKELVNLAYHRYLLQLAYTDNLIGKLTDQLKKLQLYDHALIILTADHGVSFQPDSPRRDLTNRNYQDVLPVPLIIKLPNQKSPVVDTRFVSNIDILPTIAQVLDVKTPWEMDGFSVLSNSSRAKIKVPFRDPANNQEFDALTTTQFPALKKQVKLFGSNSSFSSDIRQGTNAVLIGSRIERYTMAKNLQFRIDNAIAYQYVDLDSGFVPALISGEILIPHTENAENPEEPIQLALSVNGKIRAVVFASRYMDRTHHFSSMLHRNTFQQVFNEIEVFSIELNQNGKYQFAKILSPEKQQYSLQTNAEGKTNILDSHGIVKPVSKSIKGFLERIATTDNRVFFSGWAVDENASTPAEYIHIFINDKYVYSGTPTLKRLDVARYFNNSALELSGYNFELPWALVKGGTNNIKKTANIRIFANNSDGHLGELKINRQAIENMLHSFAQKTRVD